MKGLMLKDILNFKNQQGKTFFLLIALYFIMALQMNNSSLFQGLWIVIGISLPISSIAYDEKAKWDKYALTMPVTRKDIVTEKYLLAALFIVAGNILSMPIVCIIDKGIDMETIFTCVILIGIGIVFNGMLLPFVFKLGTENTRTIMIILVVIPLLTVYLLLKANIDIVSILENHMRAVGIVTVVAAAVIYIASYLLSIFIMEHKELS